MRLEGLRNNPSLPMLKCFNSKLVRLEVKTFLILILPVKFQFQTGLIKSLIESIRSRYDDPSEFQFQTGSIKRQNPRAIHD